MHPYTKRLCFPKHDIVLSGDLEGNSQQQRVVGLQGRPVSDEDPVEGDVIAWDDATQSWRPTQPPDPITFAGDLNGNELSQTVIGLHGRPLSTIEPLLGQVLSWDSSQWIPVTVASPITFDGDLTGTNSTQQVVGLQGRPLANLSPSNGQVLSWTGGDWAPATGFPPGQVQFDTPFWTGTTWERQPNAFAAVYTLSTGILNSGNDIDFTNNAQLVNVTHSTPSQLTVLVSGLFKATAFVAASGHFAFKINSTVNNSSVRYCDFSIMTMQLVLSAGDTVAVTSVDDASNMIISGTGPRSIYSAARFTGHDASNIYRQPFYFGLTKSARVVVACSFYNTSGNPASLFAYLDGSSSSMGTLALTTHAYTSSTPNIYLRQQLFVTDTTISAGQHTIIVQTSYTTSDVYTVNASIYALNHYGCVFGTPLFATPSITTNNLVLTYPAVGPQTKSCLGLVFAVCGSQSAKTMLSLACTDVDVDALVDINAASTVVIYTGIRNVATGNAFSPVLTVNYSSTSVVVAAIGTVVEFVPTADVQSASLSLERITPMA